MTPYRGADAPPDRAATKLWLTPGGRANAVLFSVASVLFLAIGLGLLRVESPVALVGFAGALAVLLLLERSFASIVVDGDRVERRRGLLQRRHHRISIADGCTVRVQTAAGTVPRKGLPPAQVSVHLVELATDAGSWVLAEERDRNAAEAIAEWLRNNLPPDRVRVAAEEHERLRIAEDAPASVPRESERRSQTNA